MKTIPLIDPRALRRDSSYRYELIKTGQNLGDNGNWSLIIVGTELKIEVKVGGTWKPSYIHGTPP